MDSVQTAEMSASMEDAEIRDAKKKRFHLPPKDPDVNKWGPGFIVKLVLMALVNAFGAYVIFMAYVKGSDRSAGRKPAQGGVVAFFDGKRSFGDRKIVG